MAKEDSKLGKEIENLKKRLQVSRKRLKQTELKAEDLSTLIETTRRTGEKGGDGGKIPNKNRGK